MRGQSILLTHTLLIGLGVIFVFMVIVTFASLHEEFQDFVFDKEMQQVCFVIKGGIENIHAPSSYRPPATSVNGRIFVSLPEKIGGATYRARFSGQDMIIETATASYTCRVGLNVDYKGSTSGGMSQLIFSRNSTSDTIEMSNV